MCVEGICGEVCVCMNMRRLCVCVYVPTGFTSLIKLIHRTVFVAPGNIFFFTVFPSWLFLVYMTDTEICISIF